MKIACFSFTDKGSSLGIQLSKASNNKYTIHHYKNSQVHGGIKMLLHYAWTNYDGLIFISATGIAIRLINPFIQDKTIDPAVIVVDDLGRYAISLLSGHIGGANDLANFVGQVINAMPIITTASDSRGIESIDLFAKLNNYYMEDMNSITKLTSMMVNGKKIGFYSEEDKKIKYNNLLMLNNLEDLDNSIEGVIIISSSITKDINIPTAILRPRNINIGIGCRKGIEGIRIIQAIKDCLKEMNLSPNSIKFMGTVEVKKDEEGIIEAAKFYNCPLKIFTIEEIGQVEDMFQKSQFVKDTIGVYSVSEPVAHLLGGQLILKKSKHNGITISISKEK